MLPEKKAYLQIHAAVILFGFTAILGDLIQLPAIALVWWRVFLTSISLLIFVNFGKDIFKIPKKVITSFAITGILIGLHWICFYGSIKMANASVALICMSTTSLFTSILEPIIVKTKFKKLELILGIFIVVGIILIVRNIDIHLVAGFWVGILSAFLAAIFTIRNKKYIATADTFSITFIELCSALIMISIMLAIMKITNNLPAPLLPPNVSDWIYLIILSLACTTLAQILSLNSLKYLSAFATNLVVNLEPIYGIFLAIFILHDHKELTPMFYIGVAIIFLTVIIYPFLLKKSEALT